MHDTHAEALAAKLDVSVPDLRTVDATRLHTTELGLAKEWTRGPAPILPVTDGQVVAVSARVTPLPPMPLLIGNTRNEAVFWYVARQPDGERIPGLAPPKSPEELERMTRAL